MSEQANFMQVVRGGLCFAHGPYPDYQCPKWPACGIDPQKSEYLAMAGKPEFEFTSGGTGERQEYKTMRKAMDKATRQRMQIVEMAVAGYLQRTGLKLDECVLVCQQPAIGNKCWPQWCGAVGSLQPVPDDAVLLAYYEKCALRYAVHKAKRAAKQAMRNEKKAVRARSLANVLSLTYKILQQLWEAQYGRKQDTRLPQGYCQQAVTSQHVCGLAPAPSQPTGCTHTDVRNGLCMDCGKRPQAAQPVASPTPEELALQYFPLSTAKDSRFYYLRDDDCRKQCAAAIREALADQSEALAKSEEENKILVRASSVSAQDMARLHLRNEARLTARIKQLEAERDAQSEATNAWKEVVIEACVVGCIGWDENDPKKTLSDLIGWECQIALDPRVSEEAQKLQSEAREKAEARVRELEQTHRGCFECEMKMAALAASLRDVQETLTVRQWNPYTGYCEACGGHRAAGHFPSHYQVTGSHFPDCWLSAILTRLSESK